MTKYVPENDDEARFLAEYDADKYRHPSVTADILAFTTHGTDLRILLIKRGGYPYKGRYAIPGGFVRMDESAEEAASREFAEETGITGVTMSQLATYSDVERDPRTRVISIAYIAMVPESALEDAKGGDDASEARMFTVVRHGGSFVLMDGDDILMPSQLAFDHGKMIQDALKRMDGRIEYTDDAFEFLYDKASFTIADLRHVFEAVTNSRYDPSNFHRLFIQRYVETDKVTETDRPDERRRGRPATRYQVNEE